MKTTMNWDLGVGRNQIFFDGKVMMEARWPNTDDIMKSNWSLIQGTFFTSATNVGIMSDSNLSSFPDGFFDGALFHGAWSYGAHTGRVVSSIDSNLSLQLTYPAWHWYNMPGSPYYLIGNYNLLDKEGEWYYNNNTQELFLWVPGGGMPYNVEAKKRDYALNLSSLLYIDIQGIDLHSATLITDSNSKNINLKDFNASYISHFTLIEIGGERGGFIIEGENNVISDGFINYSSGNGIVILGDNNTVRNCEIANTNYVVSESAAINVGIKKTKYNQIINNTLYNSGRSILLHNYAQHVKILYNELYNNVYNEEVNDLGGTYCIDTDGKGGEIAYNEFHDLHYAGLYFDYNVRNYNVHHNVFYDMKTDHWRYPSTPRGMHINTPSEGHNISFNSFGNTWLGINSAWEPRIMTGTIISNNIGDWIMASTGGVTGLVAENNINTRLSLGSMPPWNAKDPYAIYVDYDNNDYHLQEGSPAIDAGQDLGYTEDFDGIPIPQGSAPDIGAYEYTGGELGSLSISSSEKTSSSTVSAIWNWLKGLLTGNTIKEITGRFMKV